MRPGWRAAIIGAGLALIGEPALRAQNALCDADVQTASLDFIVADMDGNEVDLSDYEGQVILLDFWATWCAPCRIEMPWFVEFFDEYESRGFVVLAVNVDDPVPAMRSFAAEYGMDFPVLVAADRDDVLDAYGPPVGYPTGFIIGRDGTICQSHTGFTEKGTFEQAILALL